MHVLIRATLLVLLALAPQQVLAACGGTLTAQNNLAGLCDKATSRTNLGLGSIATQNSNNVAITGGTITGVSGLVTGAAGTSGQLQFNSSGSFAGMTAVNGDGTLNTATGALVVTKTNGASFATIATTGSASDLSTGTVPIARVPTGTTTSSSTVPLNNDGRINTRQMFFHIGSSATATTTADPAGAMLFTQNTAIAASTTPRVRCGANPAGTMTLVWKKNGSTTLCTMSLSTSCVVSSCAIGATSFVDGDYLTIEATADATVTGMLFGLPVTVSN